MPDCFAPVMGPEPKILILGSMPGVASLKANQYYGQPRNQFWLLLGAVLGEDLQGASYPRRLRVLNERGVALWDVIARCERDGSLDADISAAEPNAVAKLVRETGVRAVFLNGSKAYACFMETQAEAMPPAVAVHRLPSSSPAHASLKLEEKLEAWKAIGLYL